MMDDVLKTIPFFADFSEADLARLSRMAQRVSLRVGEYLFSEGKKGDYAYIIKRGQIEITKQTPLGESVIAMRGVGKIIGEMSLLDNAPRTASARASTDSVLLAVGQSELDYLLESSPSAARTILRTIMPRWRETVSVLRESEQAVRLKSDELEHAIDALQHAHDELEQRVTERTIELAQANMVLKEQIAERERAEKLLEEYNLNLEQIVKQRTAELGDANQEIMALYERIKAENFRLETELDVARQLQQMLLPREDELRKIEGLDIAGFMKPADEIGGDYYDVLQHNGHVKIGIGDVTGHGLESGIVMLMTQMGVRTLLTSNETDPTRFFSILNRTIYDNMRRMKANKSITLALLDYTHPNSKSNGVGHLSLSGQHEEMIVVRRGGKIELIDTIDLGFPIGLDDDIGHFVDSASIKLQSGDGVVLYTDGITEAEDNTGTLYGLSRLCEIVSISWNQSAEMIKQAVIMDVRKHLNQFNNDTPSSIIYDDLTLLVLKQK